MSDRISVAIVGAGRMAREHLRAFSDVPGVQVSGIASRTKRRAEALATEFKIPTICDSVADLYERTGAELVVVTVSPEAMCSVACECLGYGWNILLEKPPGLDLEEAGIIQNAARKSASKVWVALNRRFMSSTRAALADLEGRPGPRHIQVLDQLDPLLTATYGHPQRVMDSLMFFSSIHVIDYFRVFGRGAIESVQTLFPFDPCASWLVSASIRFESGDTGLYQAIWNGPGPWSVAVNTRQVRWEMRPLEQATRQVAGERRMVQTELDTVDTEFKPGFRVQAAQVIEAALGRPSQAPMLWYKSKLQTMKLIGMIYYPASAAATERIGTFPAETRNTNRIIEASSKSSVFISSGRWAVS